VDGLISLVGERRRGIISFQKKRGRAKEKRKGGEKELSEGRSFLRGTLSFLSLKGVLGEQ